MVFCRFAVADQAVRRVVRREEGKRRKSNVPCAGLADSHARSCQVLTETLVVLCETAKFEFGHGLFVGTSAHCVCAQKRENDDENGEDDEEVEEEVEVAECE